MRLPNKHPAETKLVVVPFAGEIEKGKSIASVQLLSIATVAGADVNPSAVVEGDLLVNAQTLDVYLRLRGGVSGCDYFGEVLCIDSDTLRHVMQFTLPVRSRIAPT